MDISVRTVSYGVGDHRWLGSSHGTDAGTTITLDVSLFAAVHYAGGFIPSGTCVGKVTASGLYGPYDADAVNGLETHVGHVLTDTPTDGTADVGAALLRHGRVVEAFLPAFAATTDGEIDAAGKADVAGRIDYV